MNVQTGLRKSGFTLIEIMVVVALIGILASVVLVSLSQARESSKIAKAKEELKNIEQAFKLYRQEEGLMPPGVDHCSLCNWGGFNRPISVSGQMAWATVVVPNVALITTAVIPERDPWGTYYAYDNNYLVAGDTQPSIICSLGPDKTLNTWRGTYSRVSVGDDICIFFPEPDDSP